jgi:hypothetical protein
MQPPFPEQDCAAWGPWIVRFGAENALVVRPELRFDPSHIRPEEYHQNFPLLLQYHGWELDENVRTDLHSSYVEEEKMGSQPEDLA